MIETFLLCPGSHTKVTGPKTRDATITFEASREILRPTSGFRMTVYSWPFIRGLLFVAFYSWPFIRDHLVREELKIL